MRATQLTLELLSLQVNHGPLVGVVGHLGLNAGLAHATQVDLHQDLPLHQVDGHKVAILQQKTLPCMANRCSETNLKSAGNRSFLFQAAKLWKSLPTKSTVLQLSPL